MRVVVTGSAGFIGSNLMNTLQREGHEAIGFDIKDGNDCSTYEMGRVVDVVEPDVIVHLAATCSTPGSLERPLETYTSTVTTAAMMCEAARRRQVPFILTSSVKARDGMTPYGAAKQMAETWAKEYQRSYGLPLVINRPGTVYGPGQEGSDESGWISWFLKARDEKLPVTINGDGNQVRDLLHVSDYVRLLMIQVEHFVLYDGGRFDVGGGEDNAVTVNTMAKHLGLDVTHGPPRSGDAQKYVGINDVPGWGPLVSWRDGIR